MNTYIVAYDIESDSGAGDVYPRLYERLRSYPGWARITESCWAIQSSDDVTVVRDNLMSLFRANDRLMVVQSAHIAAWNHVLCRNEWLRENI